MTHYIILLFILPLMALAQEQHSYMTAQETKPITVGSIIPNVPLQDIGDNKTDLQTIANNKPTILIFYRGGWCPFCNMQLQNLRKIDSAIIESGYQIIAISPDSPTELKRSIEKHKLTYQLYSDSKMNAAKAFGIAFTLDENTIEKYKRHNMDIEKSSGETHHLLPVPSVFIVGVDGIIKYVYSNPDYKKRLDADELLRIAKSFK